ncbi:MAG TPA: PIG-L family deacetylase [Acidimicrobiales bacterium]|nr:PIG-L family deacetylase [Acidimicrobiales bacterium]
MAGPDRRTVVFLHAHPDDEAIFTGGTMVKLAAAGWRVVLVLATGGELGLPVVGGDDARLRDHRLDETRAAAEILGIARVELLGYRDSGMAGHPDNGHPRAFAAAAAAPVADAVARVLAEERPAALVTYDDHGIYGHPDHVKAWEVGTAAAERAGVPVRYEATVDREYLHFVETHLVVEAGGHRRELGLAGTGLGVPTVAVSTVVDVRDVLAVKRRAMTAHASQIPETASAMQLPTEAFAAVYGYEWYVRHGGPGPIESIV